MKCPLLFTPTKVIPHFSPSHLMFVNENGSEFDISIKLYF